MKSTEIPIGARFGMWVVDGTPEIEKRVTAGGTNYVLRYPCVCDCGTKRTVRAFKLLGNSRSCGCTSGIRGGIARTKHGFNKAGKRHRLYHVWDGMTQRCGNHNHSNYSDYGGRGIHVCNEWSDFITFKDWALAHGYADHLEIDRKDNSLGYNPQNCRWVTSSENKRNTRATKVLTAFGETKCLTDWAIDPRCSVTPSAIVHRIRKLGQTPEQAISAPRRTQKSAARFSGHHKYS